MAMLMMILAGCGDRENPADAEDIAHGTVYVYPLKFNHIEYNETGDENWAHYRQRPFFIYTPPGYVADPPGEGPKFPVLYLLHGRNEDLEIWPRMRVPEYAEHYDLANNQ